jgi:hypothetical protein
MIGQTVSHYRILEKLGRSGWAWCTRAEDTNLGRHVALKFLPDEASKHRHAVGRFQCRLRAEPSSDLHHSRDRAAGRAALHCHGAAGGPDAEASHRRETG